MARKYKIVKMTSEQMATKHACDLCDFRQEIYCSLGRECPAKDNEYLNKK